MLSSQEATGHELNCCNVHVELKGCSGDAFVRLGEGA